MQINTKNYNPPPSEILILEFAIYTLQVKKNRGIILQGTDMHVKDPYFRISPCVINLPCCFALSPFRAYMI